MEQRRGPPAHHAAGVPAVTVGYDLSVNLLALFAVAIIHATVVDGTGREPLRDATIIVRDGKIAAVGASGSVRVPDGAQIVDATERWVAPGVVDNHIHLARALKQSRDVIAGWAAAGVAAVVENGSAMSPRALRAELARFPNAPRLYAAGPILTAPGGYPALGSARNEAAFVENAAAARRVVRRLAEEEGADFIKLAIERGFAADYGDAGWPVLTPEVVAAIATEAHRHGKRVFAHVTHAGEFEVAVRGGADVIAHTPIGRVSDDALRDAVRRRVTIVSTLGMWDGLPEQRVAIDNLRRFHAFGGRVAMGTDFPTGPPWQKEIALLREAGLTPTEVIAAATSFAGAEVTSIRAGARADLVILRRDPLIDPAAAYGDVAAVVALLHPHQHVAAAVIGDDDERHDRTLP
jgi:imidazolonepropionase-like amidohydrolase